MSMQTLGWLIFGIQSVAYIALCYVLPFRYVLRSGRFWRGVLFSWITAAAFTFCITILGVCLYKQIDPVLVNYLFDGQQCIFFILMGWMQGMLISGIALVIYHRRKRLSQKQVIESHETAI